MIVEYNLNVVDCICVCHRVNQRVGEPLDTMCSRVPKNIRSATMVHILR
jgi:hypothetical protein